MVECGCVEWVLSGVSSAFFVCCDCGCGKPTGFVGICGKCVLYKGGVFALKISNRYEVGAGLACEPPVSLGCWQVQVWDSSVPTVTVHPGKRKVFNGRWKSCRA